MVAALKPHEADREDRVAFLQKVHAYHFPPAKCECPSCIIYGPVVLAADQYSPAKLREAAKDLRRSLRKDPTYRRLTAEIARSFAEYLRLREKAAPPPASQALVPDKPGALVRLLKKAGHRGTKKGAKIWFFPCVFHDETSSSPSMSVSIENLFHCFGCGAKGGIEEMKKRGLSFKARARR